MLGGAAALIVGAFLPWVSVTAPFLGQVTKNGIDGDGVITVIGGVLVAVLGFPLLSRQEISGRAIAILIIGVLTAAIGIYDWVDLNNAVDDIPDDVPVDASAGAGLYLTVAGAIATVVGAVMFLKGRAD